MSLWVALIFIFAISAVYARPNQVNIIGPSQPSVLIQGPSAQTTTIKGPDGSVIRSSTSPGSIRSAEHPGGVITTDIDPDEIEYHQTNNVHPPIVSVDGHVITPITSAIHSGFITSPEHAGGVITTDIEPDEIEYNHIHHIHAPVAPIVAEHVVTPIASATHSEIITSPEQADGVISTDIKPHIVEYHHTHHIHAPVAVAPIVSGVEHVDAPTASVTRSGIITTPEHPDGVFATHIEPDVIEYHHTQHVHAPVAAKHFIYVAPLHGFGYTHAVRMLTPVHYVF